jgi:hypothetical protein
MDTRLDEGMNSFEAMIADEISTMGQRPFSLDPR